MARGKLKVFFGAAAGVGKTYAMLEAAQEPPSPAREGLRKFEDEVAVQQHQGLRREG